MHNGFHPAETSALLNRPVLREHADEAAFLWRRRARAARAPHYRLPQLAALDERLLAHLEGLRLGGRAGLELAVAGLADLHAGSLFVAGWMGFALQDRAVMRDTLALALGEPEGVEVLAAALAWQPLEPLQPALRRLAASANPAHRRLCVAVQAARSGEGEVDLGAQARSDDALLRAAALRAIGELGRLDLADALHAGRSAADPACRFWAAWSQGLGGDARAARAAFELALAAPADDAAAAERRDHALELALADGDVAWGRDQVRRLAASPAGVRLAVQAAGRLGDPAAVPWLLQLCEDDALNRVAAAAFADITGVDLELPALRREAPEEPADPHPADAQARWVEAAALRQWWRQERARFPAGACLRGGRPAGEAAAWDLLRAGTQPQRHGAAVELALRRPGRAVFPVAARGDWQRRQLGLLRQPALA